MSKTIANHSLLTLTFCLGAHCCLADVAFDLTQNSGGFTTGGLNRPENEWTYGTAPGSSGNSWFVLGNDEFSAATYLYSPYFAVNTAGLVTGTFLHRYSFEYETTPSTEYWDGGVLQFRTFSDQSSWVNIYLLSGNTYGGKVTGMNQLNGYEAFVGESSGFDNGQFVETSFTVGYNGPSQLRANEFVQFRFLAAWDRLGAGDDPNWQIPSLSISNVRVIPVPEPGTVTLALLAGACFWMRRTFGAP